MKIVTLLLLVHNVAAAPHHKRHSLWSHTMRHYAGLSTPRMTNIPSSTPTLSVNTSSVATTGGIVRIDFGGVAEADRAGCWIGVFDAAKNVTAISPKPKGGMYGGADMPWTNPMAVKFIMCTAADANFATSGAGSAEVRLLNMRKDLRLWLCLGK